MDSDLKKLIFFVLTVLLIFGSLAAHAIKADHNEDAQEAVRSAEIVSSVCGDKRREQFEHLYSDLSGREQRPVADKWAAACIAKPEPAKINSRKGQHGLHPQDSTRRSR